MAGERRKSGSRASTRAVRARRTRAAPIPLAPIELLAGLGPGVDLEADDLPPGLDPESLAGEPLSARVTVGEVGKHLRSGDRTLRRLIRTPVVRPVPAGGEGLVEGRDVEVCRAGVPPRDRRRPGE